MGARRRRSASSNSYLLDRQDNIDHSRVISDMAERLKLAFVGCGAIARYHLDGINEHAPRIQVTATVDVDAEKAQVYATETGGTAFTSLEEALEKGDFVGRRALGTTSACRTICTSRRRFNASRRVSTHCSKSQCRWTWTPAIVFSPPPDPPARSS